MLLLFLMARIRKAENETRREVENGKENLSRGRALVLDWGWDLEMLSGRELW